MDDLEASRDEILELLMKHLDTRDKRFMFLKFFYPNAIKYVRLEGSLIETAYSIYEHLDKNELSQELYNKLREIFD